MTRIIIEGYELDINAGLSNQITYAIDDLRNLDSKATAFSKTIVIPGTANNNYLFGNIFEFNNSNLTNDANANVKYNFNASKSARCRIEVDGLQIIKGVLRLMEIVYDGGVNEYECAVFGELGGFVSKLGNLRLEDLDFSSYNHAYTSGNIIASWDSGNTGAGYYYPLIDYGAVSTGTYGTIKKDYQYLALRPSLHVKEYLDKIISNAGYTYQSTFFSTDFFKRLIVPHNQKDFKVLASYFFHGQDNLGDVQVTSLTGPIYLSDPVKFGNVGYIKNFSYSAGTLTNTSGVALSIRVDFYGDYRYYSQNRDVFIEGYVNGVNSGEFGVLPATGNQTLGYYTFTGQKTFTIPIGGTFAIKARHTNDGTTQYFDVLLNNRTMEINSTVNVLSQIQLGDTVNMVDVIPKGIFQKDFFTSIMKLFNLIITEDKFKDKHLIIEPYINFYNTSLSSFEDWTNKMDRGSQIRVKPMSEINSRFYELNFKQDNDYYNDGYKKKYSVGYGNRVYDNAMEFAKEKESVEVIFAGSPLVGYTGESKIVTTIFKKTNGTEEGQDSIIRILQAKKITGVTSWNIMNGASVVASTTNYGYAGHLDDPDAPNVDLNFGVPEELFLTLVSGNLSNNLFNAYYSPYFAEITDKDSRLLTAKFHLSDLDIFNLDFSTFKRIDGGLYRLAKVIDFTAGANESTKVELLKTIYTTY